MEENKTTNKMSYEQLEQIAHQLSAKVRELQLECRNIQMINMFQRLDFLLKIVEIAKMPDTIYKFNNTFIEDCMKEIEQLITIKEDSNDITEQFSIPQEKEIEQV